MELRVWVDGTQRVVCGVKLTTTCQEIVFALAHATQQAGRFTMIERWRNNERLLSPNEQPLVTLQRWGEHMNEVEFILRKTSTEIQSFNQPVSQVQTQQPIANQTPTQENDTIQQVPNHAARHESPSNPFSLPTNPLNQSYDTNQQHHYNLTRRPQTSLGPLTSSNSFGLSANHIQNQHMTRLPNSFRTAMSASALPNITNSMAATTSSTASLLRPHYSDDQIISNNSLPALRNPHNGYQTHNGTNIQRTAANKPQLEQLSKSYQFEDLYSTINKKPSSQPPAVPAKPRVNQVAPVANLNSPHQQLPVNNAHMNYYMPNQSPITMYPNPIRSRHPPGYLDYLETMTRASLPQPVAPSSNFAHSNIFHRSFDPQLNHQPDVNESSIINRFMHNNRYRYSINGPINTASHDHDFDPSASVNNFQTNPPGTNNVNQHSLFNGSLTNGKPPPDKNTNVEATSLNENSIISSNNTDSVSKMGHDMLKVIEEQKKVLINQKNELEKLDKDQKYWETKQNNEQIELINRIEGEIHQLEELWKENQAQIRKLENQDLEKELEELKVDQLKIESEVKKQKNKLSRCENDIALCKAKIENLEREIANQISEPEETQPNDENTNNHSTINTQKFNANVVF